MRVTTLIVITLSVLSGKAQYELQQFFDYVPAIEKKVDKIYESLSDSQRVGQMIVPAVGKHGKSDQHVIGLMKDGLVGGVLLLNGTKNGFTTQTDNFNQIAASAGQILPIYSADAEPSLIRYKIKGSTPVKNAIDHQSREEVGSTAVTICKDLHGIGIQQNYAPVIDVSTSNEAIGNRSFGDNRDTVIAWSKVFINTSQDRNIITTAKHFPGHGQVQGDTHKKLVYIDGEMNEVSNYQPLIDAGVLSIMVAHIAVKNNEDYDTEGLPATCSREIVTDLLKGRMGFRGLVVTDAMNMGGVSSIPHNGLLAAKAGCDMLLMPVNEMEVITDILKEIKTDGEFASQIEESVKKIIKIKIILGLIE